MQPYIEAQWPLISTGRGSCSRRGQQSDNKDVRQRERRRTSSSMTYTPFLGSSTTTGGCGATCHNPQTDTTTTTTRHNSVVVVFFRRKNIVEECLSHAEFRNYRLHQRPQQEITSFCPYLFSPVPPLACVIKRADNTVRRTAQATC